MKRIVTLIFYVLSLTMLASCIDKGAMRERLEHVSQCNRADTVFTEAWLPTVDSLVRFFDRLTRDQLRLCLLMRLSFPHYVMARVMGVDGNRVTRLKAQANRRLFGDGHTGTLECNLRLHF